MFPRSVRENLSTLSSRRDALPIGRACLKLVRVVRCTSRL